MSAPKKIFIGLSDVGSQISDFKRIFAEMGIEVLSAVKKKDTVYDQNDVDYVFADHPYKFFGGIRPRSLQKHLQDRFNIQGKVWRKALKECDTFIFLWDSFQPDYSDYAELKRHGKKIVTCFVGDDVRWYNGMKQEYEHYGMPAIEYANYDFSAKNLENKLRYLRTAEKYSDLIFSRVDQSQLALRPYYRWSMVVNPEKVKHLPEQREKNPVVTHAPSDTKIKGTTYLLEAAERLKKEGVEFDLQLIQNVPNEKAVEMYANADIMVDQLLLPGTGKVSSEALCAGKVVMSTMGYGKYPHPNPEDCPIIDVGPANIYEELKSIVADYPRRKELAARGRDYVLQHLDMKYFCEDVVQLLSDPASKEYYYQPNFFRALYQPEAEHVELYNQWTAFVKDTEWYGKHVDSGERAGLIF